MDRNLDVPGNVKKERQQTKTEVRTSVKKRIGVTYQVYCEICGEFGRYGDEKLASEIARIHKNLSHERYSLFDD